MLRRRLRRRSSPHQHQRRRVQLQRHRHAGDWAPAGRPVRQPDRSQGARGDRALGGCRARSTEPRRAPPPRACGGARSPRKPAPQGRWGRGAKGRAKLGNNDLMGVGPDRCPLATAGLTAGPLAPPQAQRDPAPAQGSSPGGLPPPAVLAGVLNLLHPAPTAPYLLPHPRLPPTHLAGGQVAAREVIGDPELRRRRWGKAWPLTPLLGPFYLPLSSFGR